MINFSFLGGWDGGIVIKELAAVDSHNNLVSSHYLIDRRAGRNYQCLKMEWFKLLTTNVIVMMATYSIHSWKLCYIAKHYVLLQSIVSDHRNNLLVDLSTYIYRYHSAIMLSNRRHPSSRNYIMCTVACYKSKHVCALRLSYSLSQWPKFHIICLLCVKCPPQFAYY